MMASEVITVFDHAKRMIEHEYKAGRRDHAKFIENLDRIGGFGFGKIPDVILFIEWLTDESDYELCTYVGNDLVPAYGIDTDRMLCAFWDIPYDAYRKQSNASFEEALDEQRMLNEVVDAMDVGQVVGESR